jgi:hypothetical protein
MSRLSHERLTELLDYDPITGISTWKVSRRNKKARAGDRAGSACGKYRFIGIDGSMHTEHKLAWFYVHRQWPARDLDPANRDGHCNAIKNLREATGSQNGLNQSKRTNLSGFKGVGPSPHSDNFVAVIRFKGKKHHLGTFETARDAAEAYDKAALIFDAKFAATNKRLGLL